MKPKIVDAEAMKRHAAEFVSGLVPHKAHATVVALSGELGAGKTTFAQAVAEAFGVEEVVTSPTFVLEKIYALPVQEGLKGQKFTRLVHIDAYRLRGVHELEHLGWRELLQDPGNLIVLEWPERVAEAVPKDVIRITLHGSGDSRTITYGTEKN